MKKYDDASWHYEGDYPKNIPTENAAIHIGMFLAWCILNELISEDLKEAEDIERVKSGYMTGAQFLIDDCDEKFLDEDLSELGQKFANDYYEHNTKFANQFGYYVQDFCDIFNKKTETNGFEYESVYHVEDSWENYNLLASKIDERFKQWSEFQKKKD